MPRRLVAPRAPRTRRLLPELDKSGDPGVVCGRGFRKRERNREAMCMPRSAVGGSSLSREGGGPERRRLGRWVAMLLAVAMVGAAVLAATGRHGGSTARAAANVTITARDFFWSPD